MNADDLPTPDAEADAVSPTDLKAQIDAGDDVTILDVRMQSDYDEWHIDDDNVTSINLPYFQFLDDDIDDDVLDQIPDDEELVVLCAKGGSSEFVAGTLVDLGYDALTLEDGM
ncbi:rhodanese-like domain-containing protein, partial [Halobellus inordinatus]